MLYLLPRARLLETNVDDVPGALKWTDCRLMKGRAERANIGNRRYQDSLKRKWTSIKREFMRNKNNGTGEITRTIIMIEPECVFRRERERGARGEEKKNLFQIAAESESRRRQVDIKAGEITGTEDNKNESSWNARELETIKSTSPKDP